MDFVSTPSILLSEGVTINAVGDLIWALQNNAKILKKDWDPVKWVLIGEYSARAIQ